MNVTLYRGHCPTCGWHGRALADEAIAQAKQARHAQRTGHEYAWTPQTAQGPSPAPWAWSRA